MKQPTQGGSYLYDPKKDDLKQVEKPTAEAPAPSAPAEVPGSEATSTSEPASSPKKEK